MVRRGRAGVSGCPEHTHCAHSSDGGRGTRGRPPPRPRTIYTRPAPTRPHRAARHAPTARTAQAPPRGGAGPRAAPAPGRGVCVGGSCACAAAAEGEGAGNGREGARLRLTTSPGAVGARRQGACAEVRAHVRGGGGSKGACAHGADQRRAGGVSGHARAPRPAPPLRARARLGPPVRASGDGAASGARGQGRSRAGRNGLGPAGLRGACAGGPLPAGRAS